MKGIYGIFRKSDDRCVYVGLSMNIKQRVYKHLNGNSYNTVFNREEYYSKVIQELPDADRETLLLNEAVWVNVYDPEMQNPGTRKERLKESYRAENSERRRKYDRRPERKEYHRKHYQLKKSNTT